MKNLTSLLLTTVTAFVLGGCVFPGGPPPGKTDNVYQPPTEDVEGCTHIEYRWQTPLGARFRLLPGTGDFCTYVGKADEARMLARCIEKNESGKTIWRGEWVTAQKAETFEDFKELCPEAQPREPSGESQTSE